MDVDKVHLYEIGWYILSLWIMIICLWIRPELWFWTMLIWLWHWLYESESGGFSLDESFEYGMDCLNVNILVCWLPWSGPPVKSNYYKICFSSSYFIGCLSTVHTAAAAIPTSSRGANPDFLSKSQNYCYRWWQFGKMDIFAAKSGHWPFPNFHNTRKMRKNE